MRQYTTTFLLLISAFAYSQQLANTTWSATDPLSMTTQYFYFSTDTVFSSPNNSIYTATSTYTETGSNFTIVDIPPSVSSCGTFTGNYTFTITIDTLDFTLVSDSCSLRGLYLNGVVGTRVVTGVSKVQENAISVSLSPNPTKNKVIIHTEQAVNSTYRIYNHAGQEILSGRFRGNQETVDLFSLENGVYFLRFDNHPSINKKFIKY